VSVSTIQAFLGAYRTAFEAFNVAASSKHRLLHQSPLFGRKHKVIVIFGATPAYIHRNGGSPTIS
jgi:hypothetical protein